MIWTHRKAIASIVKKKKEKVKSNKITGNENIKRGRPNLTWDVVVRKDVNLLNLTKRIILNRTKWQKRIHVADHN